MARARKKACRAARPWRAVGARGLTSTLVLATLCAVPAVAHADDAKPSEQAPTAEPAAPSQPSAPVVEPAKPVEDTKPSDVEQRSGEKEAGDAGEPAPPPDPAKAWETAPYEHRGGFAIGLTLGLGVGAANGFPADTRKIGRAEFYTESGLGLATSSTLWLGGALADWLTFGVGGGFGVILNEETISPAPTVLFHTDVYPLYSLGGAFRNLGLTADFGFSFASTEDRETEERLIDAGGASHLFAGVLFEGIEVWKLKMGPFAGVHYLFSETIRRPAAILGFRTSLYTLP